MFCAPDSQSRTWKAKKCDLSLCLKNTNWPHNELLLVNCSTWLAWPQRKIKLRHCTWNRIVGTRRRAESILCRIIVAVGVYRISQVVWAVMCFDCEHHQCQLELDVCVHVFLRVDVCDVKSSKKRPLFLVWTNPDPMAQCLSSDFQIIFKSGDGLWICALYCLHC